MPLVIRDEQQDGGHESQGSNMMYYGFNKKDDSDSDDQLNRDEDRDWDLELDFSHETCKVFGEDENGTKVLNPEKTYKMVPIESLLGLKVSSVDTLFDDKA